VTVVNKEASLLAARTAVGCCTLSQAGNNEDARKLISLYGQDCAKMGVPPVESLMMLVNALIAFNTHTLGELGASPGEYLAAVAQTMALKVP
jgi:hypothetical protein